jgi:hypothetical protein
MAQAFSNECVPNGSENEYDEGIISEQKTSVLG